MTGNLRFSTEADVPTGSGVEDILAAQKSSTREQLAALLESRFTEMTRQLQVAVSREVEAAVADAGIMARRRLSEDINEAFRRLRQAASPEEVTQWLLDSTAAYSGRAAIFAVSGHLLQGLGARGIASEPAMSVFESLDVELTDAPALAHTVESRDPTVAIASAGEVSRHICEVFQHLPGEKVYLFPLVVRGDTAAVLYAAPGKVAVEPAPLELLAQMAAAAAEAMVTAPPADSAAAALSPNLVQISSLEMRPKPLPLAMPEPDWSALSAADRELHLRARRAARVEVAEMRLYNPERVQKGIRESNLYDELRREIDAARVSFREKFLRCESMVDYLHVELVRSLARDNANRLGRDYPGAMI
ncbi:MAG: hypothetical protein ACRD8O_07315 [Bryobacteraceae bacterium]